MKSEIRDGMHIDWDAPITMEDGIVLHVRNADGKRFVIVKEVADE